MTTVNAAWPKTNGSVPGAYAATAMAIGSATHSAGVLVPMPSSSRAPTTKPITVPPSARSAVDSVDAALVRSTDRVPSTTQNPCWTPDTSATRTAAARASDARRLFRNQTERMLACRVSTPSAL